MAGGRLGDEAATAVSPSWFLAELVKDHAVAARPSVDVTGWLDTQLAQASPDLLRGMLRTFAEALMSAEADAVCGAAYSQRSPERVNSRNGYRHRDWDTRAGTVELEIPKVQPR